jgi:hypothetical protein
MSDSFQVLETGSASCTSWWQICKDGSTWEKQSDYFLHRIYNYCPITLRLETGTAEFAFLSKYRCSFIYLFVCFVLLLWNSLYIVYKEVKFIHDRTVNTKWHRYQLYMSRDSSVGIALGYGLDDRGSGVDSRRVLGIFLFTTASRTALGPTQPPTQWVSGALSLGVKRPEREADHSPNLVPRSKNEWS